MIGTSGSWSPRCLFLATKFEPDKSQPRCADEIVKCADEIVNGYLMKQQVGQSGHHADCAAQQWRFNNRYPAFAIDPVRLPAATRRAGPGSPGVAP
jgi:hypothetical protein